MPLKIFPRFRIPLKDYPRLPHMGQSINITKVMCLKDGAHFCYCAHFLRMTRYSRATRKKCTTRRTRGVVLSPVSLGGSTYILREKCVVFNRRKIISIYLVSSLKTEKVCACCYFCRMIDLIEHFIVKQKSILKHQKLLLQDVTLGAWVLKNPLIGKDQ